MRDDMIPGNGPTPTPMSAAEAKSRRARNIAIGVAVLAFCVLIYAITLAKLGGAVLKTS